MNNEDHPRAMHKATRAIHMGKLKESFFGEVSVPIFQTSTLPSTTWKKAPLAFPASAPASSTPD